MATSGHRAFLRLRTASGLEHLPALDGLRGVAVAVVVCFHGNWAWMRGGFLGVSTFFTLSGFLICSLLLAEFDRSGFVDIADFWRRRFRRLLPAAWATLAIVVVATAVLGTWDPDLRGDVIAALLNVANWRFLAVGSSYDDLFSEASPVRHFWSLAIEEQAYVVLPLIIAVTLKTARGSLRVLAAVLGALLAGSVALTLTAGGHDTIYYGTHTRAAEILAGALLAVAVASPEVRIAIVRRAAERSLLVLTSALAFGVFAAACVIVDVSSSFIDDGGLVLTAGLSALLVFAAAADAGPVAAVCRLAPLRWLGRVSYGVYLFHWPLFVLVTGRRTGLGQGPRFVLLVALTLALAAASHRWFETPLRRGNLPPPLGTTLRLGALRPRAISVLGLAGLVVVVVAVPTRTDTTGFDATRAFDALGELTDRLPGLPRTEATSPGSDGTPSTTSPEPEDRPPTIMSFGDSVALSITLPVIEWGKATGEWLFVGGSIELGCGIGRGGLERSNVTAPRRDVCNAWPATWAAMTDVDGLDIALVHTGQWDIVDRQLPGDSTWRTVGDPIYDEYLLREFAVAQELLQRRGALVMWVNLPHYSHLDDDSLHPNIRASHAPERVERLNELFRRHVARYPDTARLIDLASWMADKVDDASLRADGTHFNEDGAERLVSDFLRDEILDGWNEWRSARSKSGSN